MNLRAVLGMGLLATVGCSAPFAGAPAYRPEALRTAARAERAVAAAETAETPAAVLDTAPEAPLSVGQCVDLALRNHRAGRRADRRVLIARDQYDEARGATLPQLSAHQSFQSRFSDPGAIVGGTGVVSGDRTTGLARVSLIVPLYSFGVSEAVRDARLGAIEVSSHEAQRVRQDIEFAVRQAYFRVLEARRIVEVVDESRAVVDEQWRVATDFHAQGLVAVSDVLTAEVQRAEREQERLRAGGNVELSVATLNRVMGVDVLRATDVADVLDVEPWQGSFAECLRIAIEERADLTALRRQVEVARAEYRASRSGQLPRVYAFADYTASTDQFLLHQDWLAGGIAIDFPLFDGGTTRARLRQASKQIENAIDAHDDRVDDAVLEVKAAWLALGEAHARLPVAREEIRLADENLRVIRDQFLAGLATTADVLREEDRRSRARSGAVQALYDVHEAYAQLTHAVGRDPQAPGDRAAGE